MPTIVLTDRERTAVQAYLRLLHTVRAAFDDAEGGGAADGHGETGTTGPDGVLDGACGTGAADRPPEGGRPPVVPPSVLAEAEQALAQAGLRGNEEEFFRLVQTWQPHG